MKKKKLKRKLRNAIADYMWTEGDSCDCEGHEKNTKRIAKLLGVKKYSDGRGYDFGPYRSNEPRATN